MTNLIERKGKTGIKTVRTFKNKFKKKCSLLTVSRKDFKSFTRAFTLQLHVDRKNRP